MTAVPEWIALVWRPPSGSSTPRVTTWRTLQRLGAARLTPGAAILPYREDLQEQFDWMAQEIEGDDGDAWVLPIVALSEAEERLVRAHVSRARRRVSRARAGRAGVPEPSLESACARWWSRGRGSGARGVTAV